MINPQSSKLIIRHWSFVIALPLFTWGLRLCCLETVPPGWRDDELINIHALSGELLAGRFPLYFTGASGHEPLYHYLLAGVHAVLGFNVLSGHFLSIALGTLTVALAFSLTCRLFGRATAAVASLALTISFWSLMYSRTAIRHISLPPLVLATFYVFWRSFTNRSRTSNTCTALRMQCRCIKSHILLGFMLGVSLYTYPAARLLPVLFILFAIYLALFHRAWFNRHWRGFLLALAVMVVLALPLGIAIAQGRTEAAAQGIGADARLDELAAPLRELQAGNPCLLLESTWTTLGMFNITGDPEWLYNIPGRPVFNLLGGALLWAGVALCLYRWRQPRYFFLLLWLGLGLSPAFVSTPPASLSHTILAQPAAYILPALILAEAKSQISNLKSQTGFIVYCSLCILFLTTNAVRDLRDYFIIWPQRGMVRLLYRADYRQAAAYLDTHAEITDIAISSALLGPWDRLALEVDIQRDDIAVRLFDPERALIWVAEDASSPLLLTSWPDPISPIEDLLEASGGSPEAISSGLTLYTLPAIRNPQSSIRSARFDNGLELIEVRWLDETNLLTTWRVAAPLALPPIPVVANPPPPGVYSGPRLAVFVHLLDVNGSLFAADDGLWVDPLTLRPGDIFVQIHRFTLSHDAHFYTIELGLYDPLTGERWTVLDAEGQSVADYILLPGEEGKP
jgi:hypothetical protein